MNKKREYNKSTGRKYTGPDGDYEKFQSSEKAKKERASRNKARREALREGKVHKYDDKDLHHVDGDPTNNSSKNKRVISRSKNRGMH